MPDGHETRNVLSFDIEDWFHILDLPGNHANDWSGYESRVEKNTFKLLEIVEGKNTKATFFILGWIAERYPHLVREIQRQGHEIGCHGHSHQMITQLSKNKFREDLLKASDIIADIIGYRPVSYRGPGFSITAKNIWALEMIAECGFKYDSTIYPARHGHGGISKFISNPTRIIFKASGRELVEFPISVDNLLGMVICFSGGGYLRLLPYHFIIKKKIKRFNRLKRPVMVYLHPRDIDPKTPKLKMPLYRKFKSYVNIGSTEEKLKRLLSDFTFTTLQAYIEMDWKDTHGTVRI